MVIFLILLFVCLTIVVLVEIGRRKTIISGKQLGIIWMIVIVCLILAAWSYLYEKNEKTNTPGKAVVQKLTMSSEETDVKEMSVVMQEAFEAAVKASLGDNPSYEEVRSPLHLVTTTNYGIRISWESLDSEYMDNSGNIVTKDIPENGVIVTYLATLTYSYFEETYELHAQLLP